jgi:hypothetical protein
MSNKIYIAAKALPFASTTQARDQCRMRKYVSVSFLELSRIPRRLVGLSQAASAAGSSRAA